MFRDSYVLCIYVMNILCTFHIAISWLCKWLMRRFIMWWDRNWCFQHDLTLSFFFSIWKYFLSPFIYKITLDLESLALNLLKLIRTGKLKDETIIYMKEKNWSIQKGDKKDLIQNGMIKNNFDDLFFSAFLL